MNMTKTNLEFHPIVKSKDISMTLGNEPEFDIFYWTTLQWIKNIKRDETVIYTIEIKD